jgi:hypothetical protein
VIAVDVGNNPWGIIILEFLNEVLTLVIIKVGDVVGLVLEGQDIPGLGCEDPA